MSKTKDTILQMREKLKDKDDDRSLLALDLIEKLLFVKKTLARLEKDILNTDCIVDMPQGEYVIKRSNPSLTTYNSYLKTYSNLVKQLNKLLPEGAEDFDSLDDFLNE